MMGRRRFAPKLYYQLSLDRLVPQDHLLRHIAEVIDFSFVYPLARPYYSHTGQPSMDPVVLFKALLIGYLYGITSERRLMEEIQVNLAYRWFLGYDLDEAIPDHSVLSKARVRAGLSRRVCCLRAGPERSGGQRRDADGVLARSILAEFPLPCDNETNS